MAKKNKSENQISLFEKKTSYTEEQKAFIESPIDYGSIKLKATAGSGKTFSCVSKLKFLLQNGIKPDRILFLSFTNAAAQTLKERIGRKDIEISTIHSLAGKILYVAGKGKKISPFYEFIKWFEEQYKPDITDSEEDKIFYRNRLEELYSEGDYISSNIASAKLQLADDTPCMIPPYFNEYQRFLRATKSRDFSDMLIDARKALDDDRVLQRFKNKYDYIFVDEYQDTSSIQFDILLKLNAKYYYLIGDINQSIYGYSGSNCYKIEKMLEDRRETKEMSLTINFRSDKSIVENSNKYSNLKATASSQNDGKVNDKIILDLDGLIPVLTRPGEVAILVRTNKVIKKIEEELLKRKVPIRYTNFITREEIKEFKKNPNNIREVTKRKINKVKNYLGGNSSDVIAFIEEHQSSNSFVTSIHKSKGREFDTCVVVNSISKEMLDKNNFLSILDEKQIEKISFSNEEERNIHYVAVSRSKHELFFMIYDF